MDAGGGDFEMNADQAADLLRNIGVLRTRCDLDLVLFFARHPRVMLASETLAAFLGHEIGETGESLDTLLGAGLIARQQTPAHAARMYVFAPGEPPGGWLPPLLRFAATRAGRVALRAALPATRTSGDRGARGAAPPSGPRRIEEPPAEGVAAPRKRRNGMG